MGDLIMSLPAVHAVRKFLPETEITLLIQKELEPLLEGHPDVDRILGWSPAEGAGWNRILRWGWRLRKYRFDASVTLNPTKLFHAAPFFAGIPTRIGYRRKLGILLTAALPDTKANRNLHETDYNLELVRLLGVPRSKPVIHLPQRTGTEREADWLLQSHGLTQTSRPIAVHPWTSNPVKSWPLESFAELADRLHADHRPILVIGGPESLPLMERWKSQAPDQVVDLVGKIPLRTLPALLRRCSLLVSNDSGPVHVAAAVGTPTIVVAPKSHAMLLARWRPIGTGHLLLLSPSVAEVVAAVKQHPCES